MKIRVNRNIFWSDLLVEVLVKNGINKACISPGSRNTPLILSLAKNSLIKSFPIVDERSSGFFALGLAKSSAQPVALITTSGTATAELYPAIIEAYQSRTPLIICTADRPAFLRNTGSNQTINQKHIFKNHVAFSVDISLPELDKKSIKKYQLKITQAVGVANTESRPVHINLQFDKPFEPESYTDVIDQDLINFSFNFDYKIKYQDKTNIVQELKRFKNCSIDLITVGVGKFSNDFVNLLNKIAAKNNIPVFADVNSGLRFNSNRIQNIIVNYETILKYTTYSKQFKPQTVIHFGRNLTSQTLEQLIIESKAKRFIINSFGDRFDSSKKAVLIHCDEETFLKNLTKSKILSAQKNNLTYLKRLDSKIDRLKEKVFTNRLNEVGLLISLIRSIPKNSNLFISNSLPVRDLDFFSPVLKKNIYIFQNRGASGIDGIISTALGVAFNSKRSSFLVVGDLSFYYDINSLAMASQFEIPLKIIVINNQGGRIFDYLPIAKHKKILKKYFQTPLNINLKLIAESFGIKYRSARSHNSYLKAISDIKKDNSCVILEVKCNPELTKSLKEKFRKNIK